MAFGILPLLALAALPSGGQAIGDAANWLHASDFPTTEWHMAAVTRYDLMVDDKGTPVNCAITASSGSPVIDTVVCKSLMERARYSPARDSTGKPIAQAIRGRLEWHPDTSGQNEHRITADLSVKTPALARNAASVSVRLVVIYDPAGAVEQCIVIKPGRPAKFNKEACTAAVRQGVFPPVKDATGQTTRGLREIEVLFSYGRNLNVTAL